MTKTRWTRVALALSMAVPLLVQCEPARGASLKLVDRSPDPNGSPRPFRDVKGVAPRTSIYFELSADAPVKADDAAVRALVVTLQPEGGDGLELLHPGAQFATGAAGWVRAADKTIRVYIEPGRALKPLTQYTVRVSTKSESARDAEIASWGFTTEPAPTTQPVDWRLDVKSAPVRWHGRFFRGICDVIFCTENRNYGPTFELMAEARREHPRAWDLQRDFWLTGTEDRPPGSFFPSNLPNIVRERETRRIASTQPADGSVVLKVEDFFGHEQYGIPSGRPLDQDFHPGDEVLIADGLHDAHARVISADSAAGTVTVSGFATPEGGWKIAYDGSLPTRENPDAPGLFPPGGCYLRKYDPPGTPCYYWGRLDKEWDLAHRYGRRVMPNFADAPGDLSRDGRSWTTVKDYAQWHEAARAIAGHIIDRYGKDSLDFTWSIFNEPDLGGIFWRASFEDLQRYYDYTTDAILRAFEERGYDSSKVFIGGLELGAIFGTNFVHLRPFLAHCSPTAHDPGAMERNAAFADRRLDGKRSRRVESLCRAHEGRGVPCDFISIHAYNRSENMAAKLIRAKEIALEVDGEYYKHLWLDSHESCPDWMPPPDEAAGDCYLGDGYFPTWCLDVVHRQLLRAAGDPRFAYGQTILTVWPPPDNFATLNAVSRIIHYRDKEGGAEQTATVPMPIFYVLTLLSDMGDDFWVLPQRSFGGHVVGGFASRDDKGVVRVLLYSHDEQDTQSRSDQSFDVTLELSGLAWPSGASATGNRFDRGHNSPYMVINNIVGTPRPAPSLTPAVYSKAQFDQVQAACRLRSTMGSYSTVADGVLRLRAPVESSGCVFLVLRPAPAN